MAECGSFTLAAQRLSRTQPAISRYVADLESQLDIRLFIRQGRSLALTPAGDELFSRAIAILADLDAFSRQASEMASGKRGVLRVGATSMLSDNVMPRLLQAYSAQWPSVMLRASEDESSSVIARLEARELDMALTRYVTTDEVVAQRLFPMHLIAIMKSDHPLAHAEVLEVAELQHQPLLLMIQGIGSRILVDQVCRAEDMRLQDIRFESRSYSSLVAMAKAGYGIAIVSSVVAFQEPGMAVCPVAHRGVRLGTWAAVHWHRRAELSAYAQAFLELAQQLVRVDYPGCDYDFPPLDATHTG